MEKIRFFKMTGSGNDFIVIDNRRGRIKPARFPELARLACRRKLSAGADGLIILENDPEVDFRWFFYNADGSEAEMCGNGARCAARFAYLNGIVSSPRLVFRTLAGIIRAEVSHDGAKIQVSPPHGLETDIGLEIEGQRWTVQFINTGVPHVVQLLDHQEALDAVDVHRWGSALRYHPRFQPAGTNANFALVRDAGHMAIRTYERGVEGETLACGTGAVAATLVAAARELVASPVQVETRSGEILIISFQKVLGDGAVRFQDVYLEGNAKVVYEAELWDETLRG
jgi:diaminopimelate epimerase